MRRFLGAALDYCRVYPNDAAYVLQCLGGAETAGRQRLAEICQYPYTVEVKHPENAFMIAIEACFAQA